MLKSTTPTAVVEQDPLEYYEQLTSQIEVLLLLILHQMEYWRWYVVENPLHRSIQGVLHQTKSATLPVVIWLDLTDALSMTPDRAPRGS